MPTEYPNEDTLDKEREAPEGASTTESEADLEGRDPASTRAADDTGEEGEGREGAGFKKRISKLTAQRREAERERDALRARIEAYEKRERDALEEERAREEATPAALRARERREAIRATLDEAYGPGYSATQDEVREERERQKEKYALDGINYLRSELEDHDIKVTDDTLLRYERAVGSELQEDHQLWAMFRRPSTMQEAIRTAFERVRDGIANPLLTQRGAKPLARIERNRAAVLGSGKTADMPDSPYPDDYTAKPPKNASSSELEEFWRKHRDDMWKRLNEGA